jgi:hypothetical protein
MRHFSRTMLQMQNGRKIYQKRFNKSSLKLFEKRFKLFEKGSKLFEKGSKLFEKGSISLN